MLLAEQLSEGSWQGDGVGDVYGTAIALIILQSPYNQLPIMQPYRAVARVCSVVGPAGVGPTFWSVILPGVK